jgi:hypothetical protein
MTAGSLHYNDWRVAAQMAGPNVAAPKEAGASKGCLGLFIK